MNLTASKSNSPDNVRFLQSAITQFENEAAICDKAASSIEPLNALFSSTSDSVESDRGASLYAKLRELRDREMLPGSIITHMTTQNLCEMIEHNNCQRPCRRWRRTGLEVKFEMQSDGSLWAMSEAQVAKTRSLTLDPSDRRLAFAEYEPSDDGQWYLGGEPMPKDWNPFALPELPSQDFRFKRSSRIITGRGFSAEKWRIRETRRCQVRASVCHWIAEELRNFKNRLGLNDETTHWITVTAAAELLRNDVSGINLKKAMARVSKAANEHRFFTNGKSGRDRRIELGSFSIWRLEQREKDLAAYDSNR